MFGGEWASFVGAEAHARVTAMTTAEDVRKLSALARIKIDDAELEKFTREFDGILAYVGQLEQVDLTDRTDEKPPLRNVMREDGEPHVPGLYTDTVAEQFPARKGNSLSVKQIISHD